MQLRRRACTSLLLLPLALGASPCAWGGVATDAVSVAFSRETDFVDRLHTDSSESAALSLALYDTLLHRDADSGALRGLLAESWRWDSDGLAVEFELRQGLRFHDGEPFDADDVVYTIGLVVDPSSRLRQQEASFGFLAGARKTGSHSVRVLLRRPTPVAEDVFASRLLIFPDRYTREHGGHLVHRTRPIGTGPWRTDEVRPGRELRLQPNPGYFDGPKPRAAMRELRIRFIPDPQTQIAELLKGTLDFAWDLPLDQARFLAAEQRFRVSDATGARIVFLSLDASGRGGPTPLSDRRVREALQLAIDRAAISRHLAGGAVPLAQHCHPTQRNCPAAAIAAGAFDPQAARTLLRSAGHAAGFPLELLVGSERLRTLAEAIQWQWRRVGVDVSVRQYTLPAWRRRFMNGGSRVSLVAYGGDLLDVAHTLPTFFDGGANDYARDAQVVELIERAQRELNAGARAAAFATALRRISDEVYTIPLHAIAVSFVHRRELCYAPGRLPLPDLTRIVPCSGASKAAVKR